MGAGRGRTSCAGFKIERNEKEMYVIVGLGNPTSKYVGTRHNAGFDAIDKIAGKMEISVDIKKHKSLIGKGMLGGEKVVLAKPQTFMNLSGEAVRELVDFYKIDSKSQLIVIYDDISLDVGRLRIRGKGSAGGHNGIKSVISHIGSDVFVRVKVGVGGKPADMDLVDYVLGRFEKEDREKVDEALARAAEAAESIVAEGIDRASNKFN